MGRIRTIKPEFPQSESMGRVSRDARLLFIMLWTLCDDSGRTRASSRMLASLLYPYDSDAPKLIGKWLAELVREQCIVMYEASSAHYLQVINWLSHQKIDRPSQSKIPSLEESSRVLGEHDTNPREQATLDQGPRTKEGIKEGKRTRETALPERFAVSERVQTWAKEKGHGKLPERLEAFIGYVKRKGKRYIDWDEAFMSAIREDWAHLNGSQGSTRPASNGAAHDGVIAGDDADYVDPEYATKMRAAGAPGF